LAFYTKNSDFTLPSPKYVTLTSQSQELDRVAIEEFGLIGLVLMENAGRSIFTHALDFWPELKYPAKKIVILCGPGQNGGDGWVLSRLFSNLGHKVLSYLITSPGKEPRGDAGQNYLLAQKLGLSPKIIQDDSDPLPDFLASDLIIDAIFGTGLDRPLSGQPSRVLMAAAQYKAQNPKTSVLAVDLPSGLSSSDGSCGPEVLAANLTVSLGTYKIGLFLNNGPKLSGQVRLGDIGLCAQMFKERPPQGLLLDSALAKTFLPPRPPWGHKGVFGHAVVAGGAGGKTGALALAALGAQRSGCGLITAAHLDSAGDIFKTKLTGAMTLSLPDETDCLPGATAYQTLLSFMENCQALGLGPGLGLGPKPSIFVKQIVSSLNKPLVLDADALTNLASLVETQGASLEGPNQNKLLEVAPRVITPHPGEAGRLLGCTPAKVNENRYASAITLAQKFKAVAVLKGQYTIIAAPDGSFMINTSGNPILATGGTGDVLTGLLTGLLAQNLPAFQASGLAVYLHGLAGDLAASAQSPVGLTPDEIAGYLPKAWAELENQS
jgi:NAD(P)H-hydrate epimerase